MELASYTTVAPTLPPPKERQRRKPASKAKLLTRNTLDGRTHAAKRFSQIVASITAKLGGADLIAADPLQQQLIEAFAGCCINLDALNARLLLGEDIDQANFNDSVSIVARLAQRISIKGQKSKPPTLSDLRKKLESVS